MSPAPSFSGSVLGMGACALAEIARAAPRTVRPTDISIVDDLCGGVGAGELWIVTGPAGVGVSTVLRRIAISAARSASVLLVDGHTPTRLLAGVLQRAGAPESLMVAASIDLPWDRADEWCLDAAAADVCVLDTWDEQWMDDWWTRSADEQVGRARILRDHARLAAKTLVLGVRRLGDPHVLDPVVTDVADVRIDLSWPEHPIAGSDRGITVRARGRGSRGGTLRLSGHGRLEVFGS